MENINEQKELQTEATADKFKQKRCTAGYWLALMGVTALILVIMSCAYCALCGDIYKLKKQVNEVTATVEAVKQDNQQLKDSVVGITRLFAPGIIEQPITPTVTESKAEAPKEALKVKPSPKPEVKAAEKDKAPNKGPVAEVVSYDMTFERYASMPEELRLTFLKEHYKGSSLAMSYLVAAFIENKQEDALNSPAGEKIAKLLSVWNILQKEPVVLQAVDKLIIDSEFFGREFAEAAELGGLMTLMEATSQLGEEEE